MSLLDDYIKLILNNNPDIDEFVYLVKNKNNDDPYDLLLKNYFEIQNLNEKQKSIRSKFGKHGKSKKSQVDDYYTISIKGLCHFKDGRPVEFNELVQWLKERETYYKIKNLSFFQNFRKWKTIKLWRKSYKSFKQKKAKKNLEEMLFINYPEMQEALINTKEKLFKMSQLKFFEFNFNKEGQNEIISIQNFVSK